MLYVQVTFKCGREIKNKSFIFTDHDAFINHFDDVKAGCRSVCGNDDYFIIGIYFKKVEVIR